MKKLLILSSFLAVQQAMACVSAGGANFCIGDKVFKNLEYSQGGTIVAENPFSGQVTVRSISNGSLFTENVSTLQATRGECVANICINDKIFKGSSYSQGGTLLGINYLNSTAVVRSISNGNLFLENLYDLDSTRQSCLGGVCVERTVYKGASYSKGGIVVGLNYYKNTATVRSISNGGLFLEAASDLFIDQGCVSSICVNDRVRGRSYSQGAIVLALNAEKYRATVRSVSNGNLYEESLYDLQSENQPQPQPQPNPWPQPGPQPQPPRPRPDPRPPVPSYAECTVNRLDPSGLFITSYVATAPSMSEACRNATNDCARDIKGRQTCNIVR